MACDDGWLAVSTTKSNAPAEVDTSPCYRCAAVSVPYLPYREPTTNHEPSTGGQFHAGLLHVPRQLSGGRTWEGELAPTVLSRSGLCHSFQLPQDNKQFFSTHQSRVSCNLSLSTYPLPDSRFWRQAPMSSFCFFVSLRNDEAVIGPIASAFSPTGFEFLNSPSHRAMSLQLPTVM